MTEVRSFAEIEKEFVERVNQLVWCSVATLDTKNRLRSRVLHPYWEGKVGWVATYRNSLKAKHIIHNPYVSLTYFKDPINPIYVDCTAAWDENKAHKQRIWDIFANAEPPLGYDIAGIFQSVDNPDFGLLKLIPWRIELYQLGGETRVWRAE